MSFAGLSAKIGFVSVLGVILPGCTKDFEGEYADTNSVEIVDDKWNDADARKTAEHLVKSCLGKNWLEAYTKANSGKKPVVLVDDIENRTDEHIDTKALTDFIRDELINSGRVRFVNESNRQKILDEIKFQASGAVAKDSQKQYGRQIGADFMLGGTIASQVNAQGGLKIVTYQTNVILTNLETAEIEFSEKYPIKKRFKRSGAGF
jgi:uncharacterized protein (TIGR02722 family)